MRAFGDGEIGDAVIYRQRPEAGRHRLRVRRAVLHLGDLGVRIGLACPVIVREHLALALAVEPYEIVDRRGVSTPLSLAIRVSISRSVSPLSRRLIAIAAPLEAMDQALAS